MSSSVNRRGLCGTRDPFGCYKSNLVPWILDITVLLHANCIGDGPGKVS